MVKNALPYLKHDLSTFNLTLATACSRFFVLIGIEGFAARFCAESGGTALWFLPFLLPAERGEIEEVIRSADCLTTASVVGVGVENLIPIAEETAQARQIERLFPLEVIGCSGSLVLGLGPKTRYSSGATDSSMVTPKS